MSRIRCLSNPESLYIWDQDPDDICIAIGKDYVLGYPVRTVPQEVFDAAIGMFDATYDQDIEYKGMTVREVYIYSDDLSYAPKKTLGDLNIDDPRDTRFAIEIAYDEWKLFLWRVTFDYLVKYSKLD